jgi:hypothetical protein
VVETVPLDSEEGRSESEYARVLDCDDRAREVSRYLEMHLVERAM